MTESDTLENPAPRAGFFKKHRLKFLCSLFIASGFVWLLHRGALPLLPASGVLDSVEWWTFGAYIALWILVHYIRAARWTWLLEPIHPVPLRKVIAVSFMGFAAIVLLPFRAGEAARPVLIRKKGHLSGWAATGTIGAERVIDGLFLSLMLLVAMKLSTPLSPLPDRIGDLPVSASIVPATAYAALALFGVAFLVMGFFWARREWARRMTERIVGFFSPKLAAWLAERVEKVTDGLRFLPRARFTVPFVLATIAYWLLNAAATLILAWGSGLTAMTFWEACVTTGVLALGILVPNAPGFFGAFQISIYASFAMYFPPDVVVGPGSAYVFLSYVGQMIVTIGAALWGMLVERTGLAEAFGADASLDAP